MPQQFALCNRMRFSDSILDPYFPFSLGICPEKEKITSRPHQSIASDVQNGNRSYG